MITPLRRQGGGTPSFVADFLMTDSEAGSLGEAMVVTSGRLTKAAATDVPDYILAQDIALSASPTIKPLCWPVDELQEWEATMGEVNSSPAALTLGSNLTHHTDGLTMSYTTSSGVFTITGLANTGNAVVGDRVRGKYRQ
jgi:hypothetical protein